MNNEFTEHWQEGETPPATNAAQALSEARRASDALVTNEFTEAFDAPDEKDTNNG